MTWVATENLPEMTYELNLDGWKGVHNVWRMSLGRGNIMGKYTQLIRAWPSWGEARNPLPSRSGFFCEWRSQWDWNGGLRIVWRSWRSFDSPYSQRETIKGIWLERQWEQILILEIRSIRQSRKMSASQGSLIRKLNFIYSLNLPFAI